MLAQMKAVAEEHDESDRVGAHPLVSVLIVNYNYARFLGQAIDSVLEQTYGWYEIVIVDDGSSDDSPEIIRRYAERHPDKVRFRLKENGGVASALNAAHEMARGEIVCLLDADDRFSDDKLLRVVDEFGRSAETGIVMNRMIKFGPDGEMTGLIPQFGELDSGWIRDRILAAGGHWSFAPASGISLRRACADQVFPIPELEFRSEADSYLFTQAPMRWAVGAIGEPLSYYRLHASNLTSSEHITVEYAQRIIGGLERMCRALEETSRKLGLQPPDLGANPTYAEMTLIRDYLQGKPARLLVQEALRFWRAAYRCASADRFRWRLKPIALTAVIPLPRRLGSRVLDSIYLPTSLRERVARLMLAAKAKSRRPSR